MSSERIIILARHDETGALELPLGDLTLYFVQDAESVLDTARKAYGPEWTLALYSPASGFYAGTKPPDKSENN